MNTTEHAAPAPVAVQNPATISFAMELSVFNEGVTKMLLEGAEQHRREKPSMDAWPLGPGKATVVDYGSSGQAMENAMAHLRESIPNGQKQRTEFAFRALRVAVRQHEAWLIAKGFNVVE